uniref:Uncharacterized protein n=1 Tax=Phenylobacterium glaciei TaxID=2803784 RepID=A0A974P1K8_9CAUL|nr:hypothetical protein JKL49_21675 [Phenylobacterium glaciei]
MADEMEEPQSAQARASCSRTSAGGAARSMTGTVGSASMAVSSGVVGPLL